MQMSKSSDKLISYFAKFFLGKFFKVVSSGNEQQQIFDRLLKIYVQVLKYQDESGNHQDQEIIILCRKIISVIIPHLNRLN